MSSRSFVPPGPRVMQIQTRPSARTCLRGRRPWRRRSAWRQIRRPGRIRSSCACTAATNSRNRSSIRKTACSTNGPRAATGMGRDRHELSAEDQTLSGQRLARGTVVLSALCAGLFVGVPLAAQQMVANAADTAIMNVDLPLGRSYPITTSSTATQASVANPDVADVVVIGTRDVVINGHGPGITDGTLWRTDAPLQHYRISVHSAADEKQVVLAVKFAEVRRNFLRSLGLSGLYRPVAVAPHLGELDDE